MSQLDTESVLVAKKPRFGFYRRPLAVKDCNGRAQKRIRKTEGECVVIKVIFSDDSLSRLARVINKGEQVQSFEANVVKIQYSRRHQVHFCVDRYFWEEHSVRITYRDGRKSVETLKETWRDFLVTEKEFNVSFRVLGMNLSGKAILVRT